MRHKLSFATPVTYPLAVAALKGSIFLVVHDEVGGQSRIKLLESSDGLRFRVTSRTMQFEKSGHRVRGIGHDANMRITGLPGNYIMTFLDGEGQDRRLIAAASKTGETWKEIGSARTITEPAAVVVDDTRAKNKPYTLYVGDTFLQAATTKSFTRYTVSKNLLVTPREGFFDWAPLTALGAYMTRHGQLLLYDSSFAADGKTHVQAGAVLFSKDNPSEPVWRSEAPLWEEVWDGEYVVHPLGALYTHTHIFLYWYIDGVHVVAVRINNPFTGKKQHVSRKMPIRRHENNPLLAPREGVVWEEGGTFNPAALQTDDKVHLVYRSVGSDGVSVMGYASSSDGFSIDERSDGPIYMPRAEFEGVLGQVVKGFNPYQSGFGWGGCEDPKLTRIGDTIYMTYVAYNGWGPPRAALTSIAAEDFFAHRWNWTQPKVISPPDVVTKSACLLPEKIQGKYVMFHRIFPDILIDYVDDLSFGEGKWLKGHKRIGTRPSGWDSRKISIGATPIRTDDGWLAVYHAVDDRDPGRYKMGVMLLDLNDPSNVLYRTSEPVLEPDMHYENEGKPGVVYPCGAAVINGELIVYYGGGDRVVCAARTQLQDVLRHLHKQEPEYAMSRTMVR